MNFGKNPFAYKLQLFDRFCTSQRVTKIGRNIFPLLDAPSHSDWWMTLITCSEEILERHSFHIIIGRPLCQKGLHLSILDVGLLVLMGLLCEDIFGITFTY